MQPSPKGKSRTPNIHKIIISWGFGHVKTKIWMVELCKVYGTGISRTEEGIPGYPEPADYTGNTGCFRRHNGFQIHGKCGPQADVSGQASGIRCRSKGHRGDKTDVQRKRTSCAHQYGVLAEVPQYRWCGLCTELFHHNRRKIPPGFPAAGWPVSGPL